MNVHVEKLYTKAKQSHRLIIGLMSGTSLDGLDIALCRIAGSGTDTALELLRFDTKAYTGDFRDRIRQVFAKRTIDQQVLSGLHALIGQTHGKLVNEALHEWGIPANDVDLLASHGQTVFHAPQSLTGTVDYPNSTLQLGDGDHLAVATGIITISDFRQKHIAAGGEGAPLAAYGDYLLFTDRQETRVLLNIGGIANFTILPATNGNGNPCFATDVGPGNTLMNQYMLAYLGEEMDRDARLALTGVVNEQLLETLLRHDFFALPFPKTTGPELFNLRYLTEAQRASGTEILHARDVMATLVAFSATAIAAAIRHAVQACGNPHVYISGGGLHNPLLVDRIAGALEGIPVSSFDELGLLPDAKEAALFALLANETVAGTAASASAILDSPAVCMGKISFPE
ncbi:anhydro-N-acetylmuramic acid kinase [Parapedobacter sp. 10938]|uniref:anhydro-N-acetylmuramic acid kinase n=1 Tax=Parapedobacter flavus TaxID=3110225 RepID=UPI002DBACAE3|nr:anhydro-N-acetylmuramic acid kinase [Parapedobacter sp. 10938]MEC3879970.1 anhydro-N-acetylmuramic acid kinase [Parapedobacter sp. 10938]